jgi:hypothetical protein
MNTGYSGGRTIRETHVIVKVKLGKSRKERRRKRNRKVTKR